MKALTTLCLCTIATIYASDAGSATKQAIPWQQSISTHGINTLKHCKVKKVHAIGHLKATDCGFNTLQFMGSMQLQQTRIKFSTRGYGSMNAIDSIFKGPIKIHGNQIHLNHSQATGINLYSNKTEPGRIYVTHHSTIQGPIKFSPNHGTVFIDTSSKINGKIIGGHTAPFHPTKETQHHE